MLDQEKTDQLLIMAEILETINDLIGAGTDLSELPHSAVTPEIWALAVEQLERSVEVLGFFRSQIIETVPLIDNDALMSHIQAAHSALQ